MHIAARAARLQEFLRNNRKLIIFGLVMFGFLAFQFVQAQDITAPGLGVFNPFAMLAIGLAMIFNMFAWAIGQMIVLLIGILLIPILGYNNFADSHVVNIGWPLVRDIMNMGVILILLYIAITKMIGVNSQGIDQALVRVFLGAVALNFSRTICVLIIDASQVVMFTFVNALQDIAAGNFAGLFHINSFMSISENVGEQLTGAIDSLNSATHNGGLNAVGYLGTSYLTLVLLSIVLVVMLVIAIVFIYRIVVLWVLIITSPVAFFLRAMGPLVPGGKAAAQWWSRFTSAVVLGPILIFFLWLALAAAGSGSLAAAENMNLNGTDDIVGLFSDAFQVEAMLSLFLGIALLLVGLQTAQNAAAGVGGVAATAVGKAKGFVGTALTLPARATVGTGGALVREAEARYGVIGQAGQDLARYSRVTFERPGAGTGYQALAAISRRGAGIATDYSSRVTKEERKKYRESYNGLSQPARSDIYAAFEGGDAASEAYTAHGKGVLEEGALEYYTNSAKRKEERKQMEYDARAQGMTEEQAKEEAQRREDLRMRNIAAFMNDEDRRASIVGDDSGLQEKVKKADMANLHLFDLETKRKMLENESNKLADLSPEAIRDAEVQDLLGQIFRGGTRVDKATGETIPISALEEIELGKHGTKNRDALQGRGASFEDSEVIVANALKNGHLKVRDMNLSHLDTDEKEERMARALARAGANLDDLSNVVRTQITGRLGTLLRDTEDDIRRTVPRPAVPATPTTPAIPARGVLTDEEKVAARQRAKEFRMAQFSAADISATPDPAGAVFGIADGAVDADIRSSVRDIVKNQTDQAYKFAAQITEGARAATAAGNPNESSDLSTLIVKETSTAMAASMNSQIDKLDARLEAALGTPNETIVRTAVDAQRDRIRRSAEAIVQAYERQYSDVIAAGNRLPKSAQAKLDAFRGTARYAS